ncbi:MAG: hypothetical protein HY791_16440 [Deltaproteobacteria bacterium]|nr:hypothetical protein [Deltaproteobacteria bacterium]
MQVRRLRYFLGTRATGPGTQLRQRGQRGALASALDRVIAPSKARDPLGGIHSRKASAIRARRDESAWGS